MQLPRPHPQRKSVNSINYLGPGECKFVSNLSKVLFHLNHLLKADMKWKWTKSVPRLLVVLGFLHTMTQSCLSTWLPTLQQMVWEQFFRTPSQMGQSNLLHSLHIPSLQMGEIVLKFRRKPLP